VSDRDLTTGDLAEFEVSWTMRANGQFRTFTLQVPAVDLDSAISAVHGLGWAINEGSGHVWKTTDAVTVTAVGS
jgi:hypothetical protein